MKYLLILLLFTAELSAQCKKIKINAVDLIHAGNGCTYVLKIDATSLGGNPSLKPRYRCGTGVEVYLNCINLGEDSIYTSEPFNCPCDQSVYIWITGYASANCHGDTCIAYTSQNLALKDREREVRELKQDIVYADHRFIINNNNITQVEVFNLQGQIVFRQSRVNNTIVLPYLMKGIYFVRFSIRYKDPITIKIIY